MARRNRAYYEGLLSNPNIQAYLLTIRKGEGTLGPKGYSTHFGGGAIETLSKNPLIGRTWTAGKYTSSAVGAFQFLNTMKHPTWPNIAARFGFKDFSPHNQDIGALSLIDEKGALPDIINGNIVAAIEKTKGVWASLPGSKYGQPTQKLTDALIFYQKHGGVLGKNGVQKEQGGSFNPGLPDLVSRLSGSVPRLTTDKKVSRTESVLQQSKQPTIERVAAEYAGRKYTRPSTPFNVSERRGNSGGKVLDNAGSKWRTNTLGNFEDLIPGKTFLTSRFAKKMNDSLGPSRLQEDRQKRFHFDGAANRIELNLPQFANTWSVPKLVDEDSVLYPAHLSAQVGPDRKDAGGNLQKAATINPAAKVIDTLRKGEVPLEVPDTIREPFKDPNELKGSNPDLLSPADKKESSQGVPVTRSPETSGQVTKSVNIHLNKPLIDNLSIVVTTATDGINDLKGKVEEALLEVLNSANAI